MELSIMREHSKKSYYELLVSHFPTISLSFSAVFSEIDLLSGVDIKGHSFAWLDLTSHMPALFWLGFCMFVFSCECLMPCSFPELDT